jgi:hypothetical protein
VLDALRESVVDKNSKASIEGKKVHKAEIKDLIDDGSVDEIWEEQINKLYDDLILGKDFEELLVDTLKKLGFNCRHIQENQSAEPDFEICINDKYVHGECKVSTENDASSKHSQRKKGKTIAWREANQIVSANNLGRAEVSNRVVVGYDGFDQFSQEMSTQPQQKLILLPLDAFVEACLWTLKKETEGKIALAKFFLEGKGHFSRQEIPEILGQYRYSD